MKYLLLICLCSMLMVSTADAANPPITLLTAQQQVMTELSRLDNSLKKAAIELGTTGLSGTEARRVLTDTCKEFNYAIDCCTIDTQGKMVTVEPVRYRRFEGKDISDQQQVIRMLQLRKPVMSSVFRSVEGDDAVDVEYPVSNSDGSFIGAVSILLNLQRLLEDIIKPLVHGVPLDIWAMDKSGRILYDIDPSQIGLNLFTSPLYQPYTHLVRLGKKMARSSHGNGSYRFKAYKTGRDVVKKAYWQSVSLYGTDWRLIGVQTE